MSSLDSMHEIRSTLENINAPINVNDNDDEVLQDTSHLYYYFFHKTPQIPMSRIIVILAASLKFEQPHVPQRPGDEDEVNNMVNLHFSKIHREKHKEFPLDSPYAQKGRAILHAHIGRIRLNPETLDKDRQLIVQKCTRLIQEMVLIVTNLIMLAYARRIPKLPKIETIESCMKLSSMLIQRLWQHQSPILQLPHITDDHIRILSEEKIKVKTLQQLAKLDTIKRRRLLNDLNDFEYENVLKVLGEMPLIDFSYHSQGNRNVTASSVLVVKVTLKRSTMSRLFGERAVKGEFVDNVNGEAKDNVNSETVNKQEFWWVYICDRKSRTLLTKPRQVTNLVDIAEIDLPFTVPRWPAIYSFEVCLQSGTYIGMCQKQELKLNVIESGEMSSAISYDAAELLF